MNSASWCSMKGRHVDNFSSRSILSFSEFSIAWSPMGASRMTRLSHSVTVIPGQIHVTCSVISCLVAVSMLSDKKQISHLVGFNRSPVRASESLMRIRSLSTPSAGPAMFPSS